MDIFRIRHTQSQIEVSKMALEKAENSIPTSSRGATIITSDCVHISFRGSPESRPKLFDYASDVKRSVNILGQ